MQDNSQNKPFDPKEFLGAKVISPLEQEKMLGGAADTVRRRKRVEEEEEG